MPKLKTRKAALKRYKKTGAGNFLRRHAYQRPSFNEKIKCSKTKTFTKSMCYFK